MGCIRVNKFQQIILDNFTEEEVVAMATRVQTELDHKRLFNVLSQVIDTALAQGISMSTIANVLGMHKEYLDELLEERE